MATALIAIATIVAACGTAAPASSAPSVGAPATPSDPAITLTAPSEAKAGTTFTVGWAGKETSGDFFVIVPAGAKEWIESADSPYVNATMGNPATLSAPKTAGSYEIWFMKGEMERIQIIKARSALTVT